MARGTRSPFPAVAPSDERALELIGCARKAAEAKGAAWLGRDDLQQRIPPEGFTREEWWRGLQLLRAATNRPLALRDGRGSTLSYTHPDCLLEWLHHFDRGTGPLEGLLEAIGSQGLFERLAIGAQAGEAIASAQLEGAVVQRDEARELLRQERTPTEDGEQKVWALHQVLQSLDADPEVEMTPERLVDLNRRISDRETLPELGAENVRGLLVRLAPLCDFASGRGNEGFVHPLVRATLVHFWLAKEHPFAAANGRTARVLFQVCLLRSGYRIARLLALSEVLQQSQAAYAKSFMEVESEGGDLTPFLLHQTEALQKAVQVLRVKWERKSGELHGTFRWTGLNPRQRAVMAHAQAHPGAVYSIKAHRNSHGVTHQTARDDLFGLAAMGLLESSRESRSYCFVLPRVAQPERPATGVASASEEKTSGLEKTLILGGD